MIGFAPLAYATSITVNPWVLRGDDITVMVKAKPNTKTTVSFYENPFIPEKHELKTDKKGTASVGLNTRSTPKWIKEVRTTVMADNKKYEFLTVLR